MQRPEHQLRRVENAMADEPAGMPLEEQSLRGDALIQRRHLLVGVGMSLLTEQLVRDALGQAKQPLVVLAHSDRIAGITWDSQTRWLTSISEDGTLKLWDFPSCTLGWVAKSKSSGMRALAHDGNNIFTGDGKGVLAKWRVSDGRSLWHYRTEVPSIEILGLTSAKAKLIYGTKSGTELFLGSAYTGERLNLKLQVGDTITAFAARPTGEHEWALGTKGGDLQYWSAKGGQLLATFKSRISQVAFTDNGLGCACATDTGMVAAYYVKKQAKACDYEAGAGNALAITFGPDGNWLAAAGKDRVIRFWMLAEEEESQIDAKLHNAPIVSLAASPDGRWIASGDESGTIAIWSVESGSLLTFLYDSFINRVAVGQTEQDMAEIKGPETDRERRLRLQGEVSTTWYQPCGTPIPADAVCLCDCVPSTLAALAPSVTTTCSCDLVCVCDAVQTNDSKSVADKQAKSRPTFTFKEKPALTPPAPIKERPVIATKERTVVRRAPRETPIRPPRGRAARRPIPSGNTGGGTASRVCSCVPVCTCNLIPVFR